MFHLQINYIGRSKISQKGLRSFVRGFFCAACTRPVRKVSSRCWWSLRSQPYFVNLLSPHTLSTWGQVFSKMYKAPENVPAFYLNLGAVYLIPGAVYLGTAGMRVLVSEEEELGTSFVTFHNLSACRTGVTTWRWKLIHFQIPPLPCVTGSSSTSSSRIVENQ